MSDASLLSALVQRVDALERQSRRLRILLFAALVLVLVLGAAAGTIAQQHAVTFTDSSGKVELSANGLYLYDPKGYARLAIYISDAGQPVIRMRDQNNKDRVYFGLTKDAHEPRISFEDPTETERLFVGLTTENTGQVSMWSDAGKAMSSLDDDLLIVADSAGTRRAYLGLTTTNESILRLSDTGGHERVFAGVYTDGTSGLSAFDADGTAVWSSPSK